MDPNHPAPELDLGRLLSIQPGRWIYSGTTKQEPIHDESKSTGRSIGSGACGRVYAADGARQVLKIGRNVDGQLWNDYIMHTRAHEAVSRLGLCAVRVPEPHFYVPVDESTSWWRRRGGSRFGGGIRDEDDDDDDNDNDNDNDSQQGAPDFPEPRPVLASERIFALPETARSELMRRFCAERRGEEALRLPDNRDCLVRVYLGSRQGKTHGRFFSLWNLKLHLNQMEELGMDTMALAHHLAVALATMHWTARVDARDVEFVIGGAPPDHHKPLTSLDLAALEPGTYTKPLVRSEGSVCLWLLDFNKCARISMDEDGVQSAMNAFCMNDPYYPRPPAIEDDDGPDALLWQCFRENYLEASNDRLGLILFPRHLALLFIEGIETYYQGGVSLRSSTVSEGFPG